jgi:YD repeat-containing protein
LLSATNSTFPLPTSYTVNFVGNLTARGADTFVYDQANRLTNATVGGTTSTYVYDGDGKRTRMTGGDHHQLRLRPRRRFASSLG